MTDTTNKWQTHTVETKYDNPWIRVEEHTVTTPGGTEGIYGKVCMKNKAIGIIAADRNGYIYLVGQHRYTLDQYHWEIPTGGVPLHEDSLEGAKRELKEETGLTADNWEELISLHTSNSVTDEQATVYLATGITEGEPCFDDTEDLAIKRVAFSDALNMVLTGEITDAISVAAILKTAYQNLIKRHFDICYQDEYCVVVNKPAGLLVHRTSMASSDREFLLQHIRNQIGKTLYPIHRLDKPTSGLVLFSTDQEVTSEFSKLFSGREIQKSYIALVRGYVEEEGLIDYPIKNASKSNLPQDAVTSYKLLKTVEVPVACGRYESSRYSLVLVMPKTGRLHQIRKHFNHLRHPLIGDTKYGDRDHNRMMKEKFHTHRLLLMAIGLDFTHPITGEDVRVRCDIDKDFAALLVNLGMFESREELNNLLHTL